MVSRSSQHIRVLSFDPAEAVLRLAERRVSPRMAPPNLKFCVIASLRVQGVITRENAHSGRISGEKKSFPDTLSNILTVGVRSVRYASSLGVPRGAGELIVMLMIWRATLGVAVL